MFDLRKKNSPKIFGRQNSHIGILILGMYVPTAAIMFYFESSVAPSSSKFIPKRRLKDNNFY